VAGRLIDHGRFSDFYDLAEAAGNDLCLVLAVVLELRAVQQTPRPNVVDRAFALASHSRVKLKDAKAWDDTETVLEVITALVEAALKLSLCSHAKAAALLARYLPATPARGLSTRFSRSRVPVLRAYCLRAALKQQTLQLNDLAHPELKAELEKKPRHQSSREAEEFKENIGALLPWHQLRATALLRGIAKETLSDHIARTRDASAKAVEIHRRHEVHTSDEIVLIWFDILHHLDAVDTASVGILLSWIKDLKQPLFGPTLTQIRQLYRDRARGPCDLWVRGQGVFQ
jgi:hypothetical protein